MVRAWWLGLCVQRYKLLLIMKMNRCILLALPLLFMLSSCGTTAQYAQQRYQDGIYSRPEPVAEAVQLYSKEDFAAMAAANIAREGKDTVYVVVQHDDWWYDSPWFAWSSAWAFSWPYRHWAFSGWYSPWYGWSRPWYDPWYSWYYDPWFYDPWCLPSRNVGRPQLHENLHLVRRQLRLLRLHHVQARHDQQPRELRKLFGQLDRKRSVSVLQPPERKPQLHARLFLTRQQQQFLYESEQQTQLFDPQPLPWQRILILVTGTQLWRKHGRWFCDTKRRRRKLQPRPQVETIKRDSG